MAPSPDPADFLTSGLRRLVRDIDASSRGEMFGLDHIVCGSSRLAGFGRDRVEYRGIDVARLVQDHSFEAVVWLLLTGDLPSPEAEADVMAVLAESAAVDQAAIDALSSLPLRTRPLEMLSLAVAMLSCFDPADEDRTAPATQSQVWRILAQLPVLLSCGLDGTGRSASVSGEPPPASLAASFFRLACGPLSAHRSLQELSPVEERAMNTVLICQCLTELRPACFAARFFGSTVRDIVPSLRSAASLYVAQLRNDPYEWTGRHLRRLTSPADAEQWLSRRPDGTLPFGFTDTAADPRCVLLKTAADQLLGCPERIRIAACARRLETRMAQAGWHPTMDWDTCVVLTLLDIPVDRMSLIVALSRLAGWAAQAIEQSTSGVSLMPQLQYAL